MADVTNPVLRIYMLGQFRIEQGQGKRILTWQDNQSYLLLARMVSNPGRRLSRKQLIQTLWPDLNIPFGSGADQLQRAIDNLRLLLEPADFADQTTPVCFAEDEYLCLADQAVAWVDADNFETLLTEIRQSATLVESESLTKQALDLYKGDYLSELHNTEWALPRRQQLHKDWIELLLRMADLRTLQKDGLAAIDLLDSLLRVEPLNEEAQQRLMLLLAQAKRRGEALLSYQRFVSLLKHELDSAPTPETQHLFQAIQRGEELTGYTPSTISARPPRTNTELTLPVTPGGQNGRSYLSTLVGRESEYALLQQLLPAIEHLQRPAGEQEYSDRTIRAANLKQCVLIMGEIGTGKTRLAETLGQEAQQRGWSLARSRVYAQESHLPYQIWIEGLRRALAQGLWHPQDLLEQPSLLSSLCMLLPELPELLPAAKRTLPSSSSEPGAQYLREAILQLCKSISERAPLLFILDDLQWADTSSWELFDYLVRHVQGYPILLLGIYRDKELPPEQKLSELIGRLQNEHRVELMPIQPLSKEQIGLLIKEAQLPEPVVARIQEQAAGNPFFAEELARFSLSGDTDVAALPATISAILDLRVQKLSDSCQKLLSKASVLGSFFEFHVLQLLESKGTTTLHDEDALLNQLQEALLAGVLTEEGSGTRITYHFWHPLLVSHLYEKLSQDRRTRTHRRAADVLTQLYQAREDEGAALIAQQLQKADAEPERITYYAMLAGKRAYRLAAYPEAERYFRQALEQQTKLVTAQEQFQLADTVELLAECALIQGHYPEARSFYEQLLTLYRQRKPPTLEEIEIQALIWCEIAWTWRYTNDAPQVQECLRQAEQVLLVAGIKSGAVWANLYHFQANYYLLNGKHEEAREAGQKALQAFEEILHHKTSTEPSSQQTRIRRTLAGNPSDLGRVYTLLGSVAQHTGQLDEAIGYLRTALQILEQHGLYRTIARTSNNLGYIYIRRERYQEARTLFHSTLDIAERIGDIPLSALALNNLAEIATLSGNFSEAEKLFERSIARITPVNDRQYLSRWLTNLAIALYTQGKLAEASQKLSQALKIGRAIQNIPCIGHALTAAAQLHIYQALASSQTNNTPYLPAKKNHYLLLASVSARRTLEMEDIEAETRLNARLTHAHCYFLMGERAQAELEVKEVMGVADSLGLTLLSRNAWALLSEIIRQV